MAIYANHPGFTPLKDSIQPQKIWNNYNIKKHPNIEFPCHAGELMMCVQDRLCSVTLAWALGPHPHSGMRHETVTNVTKCDISVTILRQHVSHIPYTGIGPLRQFNFQNNVFK